MRGNILFLPVQNLYECLASLPFWLHQVFSHALKSGQLEGMFAHKIITD